MKIDVIVPFWNSEAWLGRCCESLTTQDGDFEFILVDDQSTDNGREIAYEYCMKDQRFMLMTNHRTKGVSGARNTGIDYAVNDEAEWITFLDADDELLPNAYDTYCKVIKQDSRANIHQLNHLRYYTARNLLVNKYYNSAGVYCIGKLPQMWFGTWNKLFKREFLTDVRFNENLQYGEDGMFALECLIKDNYLHHGDKNEVAVKHRFDNKQSLSHVKTADDIYKQLQEYEALFYKQTDKVVRIELAQEIAKLWSIRMVKAIQAE